VIRPLHALRRRFRETPTETLLAAGLAVLAGIVVFATAETLFPYHSSNHDEGVYLQQASMLLAGQLELYAGSLADAFHPWFFIEDGGRLYPKYTPVPAAMYAVSMALFGEPRVTLAVVAAANAALVYRLGSLAFDRRVGLVASVVYAVSPMALLTTSVFLPYAPTTMLNLAFAVLYLRAVRENALRSAGLAGAVVGIAFFARPYTAVLFAVPFIVHAVWTVLQGVRADGVWPLSDAARRNALTATFGLLGVGVALAYNARMTGSPFVFPYEAFAPMDGPGFGERRILGHEVDYTLDLALEANGYVLWYFATRWFTAGLLGTAVAAVGLAVAARRWFDDRLTGERRRVGALLAALFVTVPLGNLAFWGNYNMLATMDDPTDGLLSQFGAFYHFDLLVPLSVFSAFALVVGWRHARDSAAVGRLSAAASPRAVRAVGIVALATVLLVGGVANAAVLTPPVERHAGNTEKYDTAYEPIDSADFENAVVFIPAPYGDWQNHPFQYLRNDPGFDGPVVYALDREPDDDFAVMDAYPNRTHYRYTYRGTWTGDPDRHVTPKLDELDVREGRRLSGETTVGIPARVDRATVRLFSVSGGHVEYDAGNVGGVGNDYTAEWRLDGDEASLAGANGTVSVADTDELILLVRLVQPDGSTLTYRQEMTVRTTGDTVEVVWPPERTVCRLVDYCDREGTYLPDHPEEHFAGVSFETDVEASS
jgi:hypothetical protein